MKEQLINAIQSTITSKRNLLEGISSNQIKGLINEFLKGFDEESNEVFWNVRQHFARKYNVW